MTRLPLAHYRKSLRLTERNLAWWRADPVTLSEKFRYYGSVLATYAARRRTIRYLGADLRFDNPATPLNLQNYPFEVSHAVLGNMAMTPRSILDVGANLGQFSITAHRALDQAVVIDAFEPNPEVFALLVDNTSHLAGIRTHAYGVGDQDGEAVIDFDPTRTGIGSIVAANAGTATTSATIRVTSDPGGITGRTSYDLVKVDVEGFEYHTLLGLADIRMRYLYLEVSGLGRARDYHHSELFRRLHDLWGPFEICYTGGSDRRSEAFDVLVEFTPYG